MTVESGTRSRGFDAYLDQDLVAVEALRAHRETILKLVDALVQARNAGRWVFVFGNGGSGATASHSVADLTKGAVLGGGPALRAMSLVDNTPLLTAWSNDDSYSAAMARQLRSYGSEADVAIAISCSGNSPNVLEAVKVAHDLDMVTFGLCGFDGGELSRAVDHPIVIDAPLIQQVEDAHHVLMHMVSVLLHEDAKR